MSSITQIQDASPRNIDFEADIEAHTIRKPKADISLGDCHECIPLLIEDIPRIRFERNQKIRTTIFGVPFWNLLIHGHAVPLKLRYDKNERTYLVDDGTGAVVVHHVYTPEKIKLKRKISELSSQVTYIKSHGFLQLGAECRDPKGDECKEMVACMETVLRKAKKQSYLPGEFFALGRKVSIVGYPSRTRGGEIHIWANEMNEDGDRDRSKEINFKKCLIRMYTEVYLKEPENERMNG